MTLDTRLQSTVDTSNPRRYRPKPADDATILAVLVCLQFMLPAKLIVSHLPLSLSAASLLGLGLGALWFCTQLTTTLGAAKGRSPVRTMLLGYAFVLVLAFASSSMSYLPGDERSIGDHALVVMFAWIFAGLAACDGIRSRDRLYFLLRVVVGAATFVAAVGALQFVVGFDANQYLKPPGMHYSAEDPVVLTRSGVLRVSGTAAHPIEFGVFCAMVLPPALHLTTLPATTRIRWWGRWASVALIASGVMFSVSRSAAISLLCVGTVLVVGWPRERRNRMLLLVAAFLVVVQLMAPSILRTLFSLFRNAGQDDSVRWRTRDYATAQELFAQHPLLGRGHGTWYAPKHPVFDNQYLLTLVETGALGLLAVLGVIGAGVYAAARVLWSSRVRPPGGMVAEDGDLTLSLIASLAVVIPTFATFDFMSLATVACLSFVLVGISGALLRIVHREAATAR
jgi:O-antigen ligase